MMPDAPKTGEGLWEVPVHKAVCVEGCRPSSQPPPCACLGAPSHSQLRAFPLPLWQWALCPLETNSTHWIAQLKVEKNAYAHQTGKDSF